MYVLGVTLGASLPGVVALLAALVVLASYEVGLSRARAAGTDGTRDLTCGELGHPWVFRLSLVVFVAVISWPFESLARTYVSAEAGQAMLLAFVIPALIVIGSPWRALSLVGPFASYWKSKEPRRRELEARRTMARLSALKAGGGQHLPGEGRSTGSGQAWARLGLFALLVVLWHTPIAVNAVRGSAFALFAEVVLLVGAGVSLWMELVASGLHIPRAARPLRMAMAAVSMWTTWIVAYVLGFSSHPWFHAYLQAPGRVLSVVEDQELGAGLLFVISAASMGPVFFLNLTRWLRSEDDVDEALYVALRAEASRVEGGPARQ